MPLTAGRSPPAVHGRRTIYGGVLFFVLFRPVPYIVRLRWRSEPPARCLKSVRRIGRPWTGGIAGAASRSEDGALRSEPHPFGRRLSAVWPKLQEDMGCGACMSSVGAYQDRLESRRGRFRRIVSRFIPIRIYGAGDARGGSCVSGRFMPGGCAAARGGAERDCAVQGGRIAVATDRKVVRRAGMSVREERVVQHGSWRQSGETCIGTVCRFVWRRAHPAVFLPAGDRTCEDGVERPIPTRTSGYKREGLCISEAISSAGGLPRGNGVRWSAWIRPLR